MSNSLKGLEWEKIESDQDFEHLLGRTCGFHDAFIRFARWSSGSFVDLDFSAVDRKLGRVWILIQAQNESRPAIELLLSGVSRFSIETRLDARAAAQFDPERVILELLCCRVEAERLFAREGGIELLGENPNIEPGYLPFSAENEEA